MGEMCQPIGLHIWGCCKAMGLQKKINLVYIKDVV